MLDDSAAEVVTETVPGPAFTELIFQKGKRHILRQFRVVRAVIGKQRGVGPQKQSLTPLA